MVRTVDAAAIMQSVIAKYPEGSLSPREVLTTLFIDGATAEEQINRLNFELTRVIYKRANEVATLEASRTKIRLGNVIPVTHRTAEVTRAENEELSKLIAKTAADLIK